MAVPLKNTIRIFIQKNQNLRKKILAILVPLFLIFTLTLKMENSILDYLTNKVNLASTLQGCHFTAPMSLEKSSIGALEQSFSRISRATSKIEDLSCNCKQLLSRMLKQNEQMRRIKFSLIKMIQWHQEGFTKYNKSIEEVMQTKGF